jgi:choline dehydrogenase-like flavoprotein
MKTGKLTIRPYSVVHSLIFDPASRKVTGVRVIDGQTKKPLEFKGRIIFLNAATLESTRILLNSATPEFPNGLANSSGELGHNLMDHHMGAGASGIIPGNEDKMPFGNRPNGIYVPRFRNVKTKQKDFMRGYGYQGGGSREGWSRGTNMTGIGVEFKQMLRKPGPWRMTFAGFGECLPYHTNWVEVDKDKVDAWGIRRSRFTVGGATTSTPCRAILRSKPAKCSRRRERATSTRSRTFPPRVSAFTKWEPPAWAAIPKRAS